MAADAKTLTAATLGVTQTVAIWSVVMPPISEVRSKTPGHDPAFTDGMRQTELVVGTVSIGIGYVMSKLAGSYDPLLCAALTVLVLIGAYEYVLHSDTSHLSIVRRVTHE